MPAAKKVNRRQVMLTMGAAALVGGVEPQRPLSDGAKLLAACAPPNPYQRSYLKFWNELVWTADEARAGETRKAPAWPYFADLEEDFLAEPLLFLDKARRVLASWFACAFDVWLLSGGQDPRWPVLMRSRRNRQVILAARKMEDIQGSAWFLQNRVKFIVDELEARGIRDVWPEFPEWEWTATTGRNSAGGKIDAVPQGKDQMRGPGATLIHMEEVAFWDQAKPSIESAKMVTLGGGHVIAISTAQVNSYAADLVLDQVDRGWR